MRRATRWISGAVGLILVGATGCTHNHYYGAVPVCEAPAARVVTQQQVVAGAYCDVPTTSGTPVVVATTPGRASTVVSNRRPPTLVTSKPSNRLAVGGWRNRRDPGGATTQISGTLDDEGVTR